MEKKTIGAFIAALRKANGLTQKQLAEKLNVSDKAISRWERDECAPDLSLIPVLAEIFGITCDELLRGERKAPDAPPSPTDTAKSGKQLKRLLTAAQTKFRIRSIITIAIAIVGVIVEAICNHGLNQAAIGFMIGMLFFVIAIICQIIFLILGFSAINAEDLAPEDIKSCKRSMIYWTELTISIIAVFTAGSSPLVSLTDGLSYIGVSAYPVFTEGLIYSLFTGIICLIFSFGINLRTGYANAPKFDTPVHRLRLRCAGILAIVLVVLIYIHAIFASFLSTNMHLYAECQRFDTFEEFKAYMETPVDPYGYPMTLTDTIQEDYGYGEFTRYWYSSPSGEFELNEQGNTESLLYKDTPEGEEAFYTYLCLNLYVACIETSDFGDVFPVYTFTADQYQSANSEGQLYTSLYSVLYVLAVALTYAVYRKKLKMLS